MRAVEDVEERKVQRKRESDFQVHCVALVSLLLSHKSGQSPVFVASLQDRLNYKKKTNKRLSSTLTYDFFFRWKEVVVM